MKIKYKFWIKSSRGTNAHKIVELPKHYTENDIQDELEIWCVQFGAWHVSENMVRYGWDEVK